MSEEAALDTRDVALIAEVTAQQDLAVARAMARFELDELHAALGGRP